MNSREEGGKSRRAELVMIEVRVLGAQCRDALFIFTMILYTKVDYIILSQNHLFFGPYSAAQPCYYATIRLFFKMYENLLTPSSPAS